MRKKSVYILKITLLLAIFELSALVKLNGESDIIKRSPFVWQDFVAPQNNVVKPSEGKKASSPKYEFNGVYSIGNKYHVLISENNNRSKGKWYAVPSEIDGLEIKNYDKKNGSVLIMSGSDAVWVEMKELTKTFDSIPLDQENTTIKAIDNGKTNLTANNTSTSQRRVVRPSSRSESRRRTTGNETKMAKKVAPPKTMSTPTLNQGHNDANVPKNYPQYMPDTSSLPPPPSRRPGS